MPKSSHKQGRLATKHRTSRAPIHKPSRKIHSTPKPLLVDARNNPLKSKLKSTLHTQQNRSFFFSQPNPEIYTGPRRSPAEMYTLYDVTPSHSVPSHIPRPDYADYVNGQPSIRQRDASIEIKTPHDIQQMRKACEMASYIREFAGNLVRPGISLDEIDAITHDEIVRLDAYPSPLGYYGFPKCIAASPNNVICHGIPDKRVLEEGDIVNLDVTIFYDGFHGDCSGMFGVGRIAPQHQQLIDATWESLVHAIDICRPGRPLNAIGSVIHDIADSYGFGVNPTFCGHGIGREFHCNPTIYHRRNDKPGTMAEGMVFTIEPIFTETKYTEHVKHTDGWAVLTVDGSWAAQFEQTVAITKSGAAVLTQHKPGYFDKKM